MRSTAQLNGSLWLLLVIGSVSHAAKILGIFPHASEGHFAVMRTVMQELANKEHNVTIYSSHRLSERIDNLNEVIIEPEFPFWINLQEHAGTTSGDLQALGQLPALKLQKSLAAVGAAGLDYFLRHQAMQALLKLTPEQFDYDIIILDLFYTEALLALGYIHAKPLIGIVNSNFGNYIDHVQESIVPVACSPIGIEQYTNDIGYWQRLANVRDCIARRKHFVKYNYGAQDELVKKHFQAHKVPSISELQNQISVLLLNNYAPLLTPRPLLQNIIPAGGLHIRSPRELPWHIKRYLDESRIGVIYMNLGNEQSCGDLPKQKLQILFEVLGKRKERVLWTCHDTDKIDQMPKNMLIQHAVPQTDILAHPHVRAFLMNGDILSLQEGIVRHVPMLGLPIFSHEVKTMELAEKLGVAVKLEYTNFSSLALDYTLNVLLTTTQFPLRIRQVSTEFRDRPMGALASTMFWVDYVLRHNGGANLKTRGIGIPSSHLHLIDLFIFYFGMFAVLCGLVVGVYFLAMAIWKKKQNEIKFAKLN